MTGSRLQERRTKCIPFACVAYSNVLGRGSKLFSSSAGAVCRAQDKLRIRSGFIQLPETRICTYPELKVLALEYQQRFHPTTSSAAAHQQGGVHTILYPGNARIFGACYHSP